MHPPTCNTPPLPGSAENCAACMGRRTFFKLGLGAAAAATLASLIPSDLKATPVRPAAGRGAGVEVRYPIPETDGVEVDRSRELILVRGEGRVTAFALSCPHQRSMLRWKERDGIFQCTKHHSEYDPSGVYQKGRATRNMDRLAIRAEGREVVVDPETTYHSDEDPAGWAAAFVSVD